MSEERVPIEFETTMVGHAVFVGGGEDNGSVELFFFRPDGEAPLKTRLIPSVVQRLLASLAAATNSAPQPMELPGLKTPRKRPATKPGEIHFGQEYPPDIMQTLGVLMVRVNLLERSLVKVLAVVGTLTEKQAESLFYSTQNMKARLDMIRAMAEASGQSAPVLNMLERILLDAKNVSGWKATRKWMGDQGFAQKGQPVHHWLAERNVGWGRHVPNVIKNQPWNAQPLPSHAVHTRFRGAIDGLPKFNPAERFWYGTPPWFKGGVATVPPHAAAAAQEGLNPSACDDRPRPHAPAQ